MLQLIPCYHLTHRTRCICWLPSLFLSIAPPFFQPARLEILELVFILLVSYSLAQSLTKFIQFVDVSFLSKSTLLVPLQGFNSNSSYFTLVQLWCLIIGPFPHLSCPWVTTRLIVFKHHFDHVSHLWCLPCVYLCCTAAGRFRDKWSGDRIHPRKTAYGNCLGNLQSPLAYQWLEGISQWKTWFILFSIPHFSNLVERGNIFFLCNNY